MNLRHFCYTTTIYLCAVSRQALDNERLHGVDYAALRLKKKPAMLSYHFKIKGTRKGVVQLIVRYKLWL